MKNLLIILSLCIGLYGLQQFGNSEGGKYVLGVSAKAQSDTLPANYKIMAVINSKGGGGNGNGNGNGNGGGNPSGPDTATQLRADTIKWNFTNGTAAYNVVDSINLRWNNVKIQTYSGAGKMDTFVNQKWADAWKASNVTLVFFHGAGSASYRFADCVNPIVPSPVFQYASLADGSLKDSIGDPAAGGRKITFTGLTPNGTYTIQTFGTKDSGIVVSQTLSIPGQSATQTYNINNNCSNYGSVTGTANSSGVLVALLKGASTTSKTYINAIYLITNRVTNRILSTAVSGGATGGSSGSGGTPSTTTQYPYPANYKAPQSVIPFSDSILPPFFSNTFYSGLNMGYYGTLPNGNLRWTDDSIANRIWQVKGRIIRTSLPEWLIMPPNFDTIRLRAYRYYKNTLGMKVLATLGEPASGHGDTTSYFTNSAGQRIKSKIFANLYKKIFDTTFNSDGSITVTVNPNNYWAKYVDSVGKIYGPYIDFWEVVNEADFTNNSAVWQGSHMPQPGEMTNIYAPFPYYVRMLRIASLVLKRRNPNALVAPGGLGYWQFWESLCKWSDNPVDGSLNDDYPRVGAAYIDVLSYHTYNQYYTLSNYPISGLRFANSDTAASMYMQVQAMFADVSKKYGWDGSKYPRKHWFISETGVGAKSTYRPVLSVDKSRDLSPLKTDTAKWDSSYTFQFLNYGDYTYQRNFIIKSMIEMERVGVQGVTIFTTGEHDNQGDTAYYYIDSTNYNPKKTIPVYIRDGGEFAYFGFYNNMNVNGPGQEALTPQGIAYKTYATLIGHQGYVYDSTRTKQLGVQWNYNAVTRNTLPVAPSEHTYGAMGPINGAAFFNATLNKWIYVVWARQTGDRQEGLTYNYTFPALGGVVPNTVKRYNWDYSATGTTTTISNSNILLTGAPSFFEIVN